MGDVTNARKRVGANNLTPSVTVQRPLSVTVMNAPVTSNTHAPAIPNQNKVQGKYPVPVHQNPVINASQTPCGNAGGSIKTSGIGSNQNQNYHVNASGKNNGGKTAYSGIGKNKGGNYSV
jgi:hypothetical protein